MKPKLIFPFFHFFKNLLILIFIFISSESPVFAQDQSLEVGVRFQKAVNLYYENGITVQYSNEQLLDKRLFVGISYVTSRLGSAMGSNALKQDNYLLSGTYLFRPERNLQPFLRLNTGYFYSDYEEEIFDNLPNSSFLLSPETGISFKTNSPFKIAASVGYNLITGNGINGPGTLFPVFIQTSLTWNIFHKNPEQ